MKWRLKESGDKMIILIWKARRYHGKCLRGSVGDPGAMKDPGVSSRLDYEAIPSYHPPKLRAISR